MLVLVVGPSGAGKDTLLNAARETAATAGKIHFAQRQITRPPTPGEDHAPVDYQTFQARRAAGLYALSWEAHGLAYGISADIAAHLDAGRVVVASVSRSVIAEAATRFRVRVVEITAPPEVLAARLAARARESAEDIARRLQRQVPLPEGIERITVMNDSSIAEGAARLLMAFSANAEASAR